MARARSKIIQSEPASKSDNVAPIVRRAGYTIKASRVRERREQVEGMDTAPVSLSPRPRDEAIANATVNFKSPEHALSVITTLWEEVRQKFLAIGRNLREAKFRYPQAFEKTILPQLPFGKQVAYQLRVIADAVDRGRLNEHEMPQSYGAAYQLANLDETDFKLARDEGLVRPDVQRRRIELWKRDRELRRRLAAEGRVALLREERVRLHGEAAGLRDRLIVITSRLDEIDVEIDRSEGVTIEGQIEAEASGMPAADCLAASPNSNQQRINEKRRPRNTMS